MINKLVFYYNEFCYLSEKQFRIEPVKKKGQSAISVVFFNLFPVIGARSPKYRISLFLRLSIMSRYRYYLRCRRMITK